MSSSIALVAHLLSVVLLFKYHVQEMNSLAPWRCDNIFKYCKTSNIRRTWVGNKLVDHSDVAGASPVGAAPTTSSFST